MLSKRLTFIAFLVLVSTSSLSAENCISFRFAKWSPDGAYAYLEVMNGNDFLSDLGGELTFYDKDGEILAMCPFHTINVRKGATISTYGICGRGIERSKIRSWKIESPLFTDRKGKAVDYCIKYEPEKKKMKK